ncbi:MAG: hypothetical protein R6W80_10340, partial [Haliea sp.]
MKDSLMQELTALFSDNLRRHKRYAKHPSVDKFSLLAAGALLGALRSKASKEQWDADQLGREKRISEANKAALRLHKAVNAMSPKEYYDWFDTVFLFANHLSGKEDKKTFYGRRKQKENLELLIGAMGMAGLAVEECILLIDEDQKPRAVEIEAPVLRLAKAWIDTFHEIPKAAASSPFTTVVATYFEYL